MAGHKTVALDVVILMRWIGLHSSRLHQTATLLDMRLSPEHRLALKSHFARELGADCELLLFGSRTDDDLRGGDVDLLVRSPRILHRHVWLAARLAAHAERLLGGRRVDVLLLDPATPVQPVHAAALATGVAL